MAFLTPSVKIRQLEKELLGSGRRHLRRPLCRLMAFSCWGSRVSLGIPPSLPFVSGRMCVHTREHGYRAVGWDSITFGTHPCVKEGRTQSGESFTRVPCQPGSAVTHLH